MKFAGVAVSMLIVAAVQAQGSDAAACASLDPFAVVAAAEEHRCA